MDKNDFEINGDKLIKYCGRGVNCSDPLCIPDGIRVIGKDSFSGMNSLKTCIRIPVGVELLGCKFLASGYNYKNWVKRISRMWFFLNLLA